MDYVNEYLRDTLQLYTHREYSYQEIRPKFHCKDGFAISIQASSGHYCEPRRDNQKFYSHVELGFPSDEEPLISGYAEDPDNLTDTVYGWVPIEVVNQMIENHGGPGENPDE